MILIPYRYWINMLKLFFSRAVDTKHVTTVSFCLESLNPCGLTRAIGRFLCNILRDLVKWYQDEQLYNKENKTKVDGKDMFFPSMTLQFSTTQLQPEAVHIDWSKLQTLVRKFYRKLALVNTTLLYLSSGVLLTYLLGIPAMLGEQGVHACLQRHCSLEGDSGSVPSC